MIVYQGEVRQVGIEVSSQLSQDFVIEAAEYTVTDKNENLIEEGFPDIDGHKITTLFSAEQKGTFYVTFKYHIGPEILKARIVIEVR